MKMKKNKKWMCPNCHIQNQNEVDICVRCGFVKDAPRMELIEELLRQPRLAFTIPLEMKEKPCAPKVEDIERILSQRKDYGDELRKYRSERDGSFCHC